MQTINYQQRHTKIQNIYLSNDVDNACDNVEKNYKCHFIKLSNDIKLNKDLIALIRFLLN